MAALTALRATPIESGNPSADGTATLPPSDDPESDPITLSVTDDLARTFDLSDSSLGGVTDLIGAVVDRRDAHDAVERVVHHPDGDHLLRPDRAAG